MHERRPYVSRLSEGGDYIEIKENIYQLTHTTLMVGVYDGKALVTIHGPCPDQTCDQQHRNLGMVYEAYELRELIETLQEVVRFMEDPPEGPKRNIEP